MAARKPQKIESQVVEAIRRLQSVQGSTPREISSYISQEYDLPSTEIRRQVQVALKRGVAYGILQKLKGGCYTYNLDFLERHPLSVADNGVEAPSHRHRGRRRRRRSSRRRRSGRRRGRRSRRRRSGRRRSRRRRSRRRRRADVPQDIDTLDVNTVAKQPKRSNSVLRNESPQSGGSSISGASEGKQEE
ncbi:uncharacterized protein LOC143215349 [Lasioglossum baleicum]|uniref:uncharacterized protein LOC143215349 n=1 Tax=Lasioglossum baleicum TaxID=434251 RepID=UPI003FCC71AC